MQTIRNLEHKKKQCIVAYGTSLTADGVWVDELRLALSKRYPGLATVRNAGASGMWSQWGIDNLEERVLSHKPDMVFLEFSINDAYLPYETGTEQSGERLKLMMDRIWETNPLCDVVVLTMNPPVGEHLQNRPHIEDYYEVYRQIAWERKLPMIDHHAVWKAIWMSDKERFEKLVPDGIHPSPEGERAVIVPGIEDLLFQEDASIGG